MRIFHYTTIESLALILSHKTIKFSRLDKVDDLDEGKIEFGGTPLSHIFFASCWSMDANESIAMWKLYTRDGVGVRIELDSETIFDNPIKQLFEKGLMDIIGNKHYFDTILIFNSPVKYVPYPLAIIQASIKPYANYKDLEGFVMDSNVIGFTKDTSWSFQQEYRFLKMILPRDHKTTNIIPEENFNLGWKETYSLLLNGQCPEKIPGIPLEEVYVPIGEDAFHKIKIVLGPNCKEEHRLIVKAICCQFGIDAIIDQSHLSGRIRFK